MDEKELILLKYCFLAKKSTIEAKASDFHHQGPNNWYPF